VKQPLRAMLSAEQTRACVRHTNGFDVSLPRGVPLLSLSCSMLTGRGCCMGRWLHGARRNMAALSVQGKGLCSAGERTVCESVYT
jgi:hypothetical protein